MCLVVIHDPAVCEPPPAVLTYTLPSSDTPYSPPNNSPYIGPLLVVPSRLLEIIPAVPVGPWTIRNTDSESGGGERGAAGDAR